LNSQWAGPDNFKYLFMGGRIWILLRNTIAYNIVFIILGIVVPVSLAIIISMIRNQRGAKAYQTMMFFPHFLSWVVVSYFVYAFLNAQ
ncbi:sugar ABC transporter permease, partial [Escherichia coli]